MTKEEFEFILDDRIAKIKAINEQYNLLDNSYIAFSGGKDSTILHYLIDLALPDNKIPRVFANTGIEFIELVKFVKNLARNDTRIVVYNSGVNIKKTLEKYGYPFKSKQFSQLVRIYHNMKNKGLNVCENFQKRIRGEGFQPVPKGLRYLFEEEEPFKISQFCCSKVKKEPANRWAKANNKNITITGLRAEEGGNRKTLTCITSNGKKFHPLVVVSEEWENMFVEYFHIELCKLYYEPYNMKRTGCKGCPFGLRLQKDLDMMEKLLPNEKKQCEIIWKPVYKEYRRIGYRLRKEGE